MALDRQAEATVVVRHDGGLRRDGHVTNRGPRHRTRREQHGRQAVSPLASRRRGPRGRGRDPRGRDQEEVGGARRRRGAGTRRYSSPRSFRTTGSCEYVKAAPKVHTRCAGVVTGSSRAPPRVRRRAERAGVEEGRGDAARASSAGARARRSERNKRRPIVGRNEANLLSIGNTPGKSRASGAVTRRRCSLPERSPVRQARGPSGAAWPPGSRASARSAATTTGMVPMTAPRGAQALDLGRVVRHEADALDAEVIEHSRTAS